MQCSKCGTTVQISDRFCEECGSPLAGCEKCGASATEIDKDGFCTSCGFRREAPVDDRFEVVLSERFAGVSDRGLRHLLNEDYVACASVDGNYVMVVCDGVSSSQLPSLASKAACEVACGVLERSVKEERAINSALTQALASVCAISYNQNEGEPPSTTIVAAVVVDGVATIGWLGDSRAYWISLNGSRLLTTDHSWFNDVVSSGEMSEAQARISTHAHAITRWLGADAMDLQPSIVNFVIPGAGYLLLCSDGLWNYAPELPHFEALVKQFSTSDAGTMAHNLVEFARSRGGHDNITVAVLAV
jgi:PPM family protein phosphatase